MARPAGALKQDRADAVCRSNGYDFAYAMVEVNGKEEVECGTGPGTSCDREQQRHCEGSQLFYCFRGKISIVDCQDFCRTASETPSDGGTCGQVVDTPQCQCHYLTGKRGDPGEDIRFPGPPAT